MPNFLIDDIALKRFAPLAFNLSHHSTSKPFAVTRIVWPFGS
jgi:hypothetical protein